MTAPAWATQVPNAAVHTEPAKVGGGASTPMPWQQLVATVEFFVESFVGQIAVALGGIEIFGWKPLQFLADWGNGLIAQASDAYTAATAAQSTANTAQTNATSALGQIGSLIFNLLTNPGAVLGKLGQDMVDGLQSALSFLTTGVSNAASGLANLINSLLNNTAAVLGSIPQNLVSGLSGALAFVTDGLASAGAFIQNIVNTIWSALRGIPLIGGFVPGLPDLSAAVTDDKVNQQNFTISAVVSDYRNPTWVSRYPVADVSFPEFMLNRTDVFGTTDTASTGTAHTHTVSLANSVYGAVAGRSVAAGGCRGVYITVSNTTVFDTLMVFLWNDAGPVTGITLDTFRERSDGSMYRIFTQDISSLVTTTSGFKEVTLPELLVAQAGERYMIRIGNGSASILWVAAMIETAGAQEQGFAYAAAASPLNTASSYSAAEALTGQANTTAVNWTALVQKVMPTTDRSYSDDANRSAIGGLWYRKSSTASLLDIYDEEFGYTSSTDGSQSAIYIHPTTRDVSRVEANLTIDPTSTAREGVLLHCNRDMSQMVYLGVNGTSAKIYSGSHLSLTERASLSTGGTGLWTIYYDQANDKYVALKDGNNIGLQWTSVSTAVSHGSDYRYGGIRIECASSIQAGTVDNWTLRDWLIAVPATVNVPAAAATASVLAPAVTAAVSLTPTPAAATADAIAPALQAGTVVNVPAAGATADALAPSTSNNSTFPYQFPYNLT